MSRWDPYDVLLLAVAAGIALALLYSQMQGVTP